MCDKNYNSSVLLVYLAIKYGGDLEKILTALELKEIDIPYEEALKVYQSLECQVVTLIDYDYPKKLKQAHRPPIVLFYYGDLSLLDKKLLAVVGSREYNEVGEQSTYNIINGLKKDVVIISGLAKGIDAIAHQCAIDNGLRTVAVLGSGLDHCYPSENKQLYEEIKKNHLLISEYPFDSMPDREHFPMRNRIISALADAIYIPQINSYMSGTMISITLGLSLGKPIFVAPHPQWSETINNKMINEGAILAESTRQMMEELGWRKK